MFGGVRICLLSLVADDFRRYCHSVTYVDIARRAAARSYYGVNSYTALFSY